MNELKDEMVDALHESNHYAGEEDDATTFQESLAFTWVDPVAGAAGWHHYGLQRGRGIADINSFLSHRSVVVGRAEELAAPLPTGDFADTLTVGNITRKTLEPLHRHNFTFDHGPVQLDLTMTATLGPIDWHHASAPSHWESFGRVEGTLVDGDESVSISGWAFQDRSWGHRSYSAMRSCRIVTGIFGPDLVVRVIELVTETGRLAYGNAFSGGRRTPVADARLDFTHDADDLHLSRAEADVWLSDGTGLHLEARPLDHEIQAVRDGFITPMSNCVVTMGSRVGTGFILEMGNSTPPQLKWQRTARR